MVFGLIAFDGKDILLVFKAGVKVDSNIYLDVLHVHVKPCIESKYTSEDNVIFQQVGASPHMPRKTQNRLEDNIPYFWLKDIWPLSSPDLSPLDFSIWVNVEGKSCSKLHNKIEALKKSITRE